MSLCKKMKDMFGDDLKFMAELGRASGREQGAAFCELSDSSVILGTKTSGEKDSVIVLDCPPETKQIGDYHVHGKDTTVPSPEDIRTGTDFLCIGNNDAEMRCIDTPIDRKERNDIVMELRRAENESQYQDCLKAYWEKQPKSAGVVADIPEDVRWSIHERCADPVINKILAKHNLNQCQIQL